MRIRQSLQNLRLYAEFAYSKKARTSCPGQLIDISRLGLNRTIKKFNYSFI